MSCGCIWRVCIGGQQSVVPGRVEAVVAGGTEVVLVLAEILELFPAGVLLVGIQELVRVRALEAVPAGGTEVVPASG